MLCFARGVAQQGQPVTTPHLSPAILSHTTPDWLHARPHHLLPQGQLSARAHQHHPGPRLAPAAWRAVGMGTAGRRRRLLRPRVIHAGLLSLLRRFAYFAAACCGLPGDGQIGFWCLRTIQPATADFSLLHCPNPQSPSPQANFEAMDNALAAMQRFVPVGATITGEQDGRRLT